MASSVLIFSKLTIAQLISVAIFCTDIQVRHKVANMGNFSFMPLCKSMAFTVSIVITAQM